MDPDQLITQTERLICAVDEEYFVSVLVQTIELVRNFGGRGNAFLSQLLKIDTENEFDIKKNQETLSATLDGFHAYLKNGLLGEVSPEQQARTDVVSDFLDMAQNLLESKDVHPAAPAVLIGATIEELLRNWVEKEGLSLGHRKPGIENYSQILREADLITKQDGKDITSWAGIRNHAAHGEWDEVSDKNRIKIMLEGVNLFMRKYSR